MTTQTLTNALLKLSDIQTEVLYFIEKYGNSEKLPWEKYFEELYVNFDILLPTNFDENDKKTFIGLSIIDENYDLYPSTHPRLYYFYYNEKAVHQFDDAEIGDQIVHNAAKLVVNLYHAEQKNETDIYYKWIKKAVNDWNSRKYVRQEQVLNLSSEFSISEIAKLTEYNEGIIYKIIQDVTNRIDQSAIDNLQRFNYKVSLLIDENPELNEKASFLNFLLDEIKNGGKNINEPSDLLPQFYGINVN